MNPIEPTADPALPQPLRGFEHVNRYWDRQLNIAVAKILPGELYVSINGEMIATVLGSCISVCIRDWKMGIGGMNHFMLPVQVENSSDHWSSNQFGESTRYGNWAMECLINEIMKAGGSKNNLEIKVFGGGSVLNHASDVGKQNIVFVKQFLKQEGFSIAAEDTGDIYPRKVLFFSKTGAVKVRKLKTLHNATIAEREQQYRRKILDSDQTGTIELF